MIIHTEIPPIHPHDTNNDLIDMINESITIKAKDKSQKYTREDAIRQWQKYMKKKPVKNNLLYQSSNKISEGAILSISPDFHLHNVDPYIHIYTPVVNGKEYALPAITYINKSGSIITLVLRDKNGEKQITEIEWKTKIPTNTSKFFGGINHFNMKQESHTVLLCGNNIIIRNNKSKNEKIFKTNFYARSTPYIKVLNQHQIMIIFQDITNSLITYTIDLETDFAYFFEAKSNLDAIVQTAPIILEHNNKIFFSNGNEVKILHLNHDGTIAEIASTDITLTNQEAFTTYPFIHNNNICFWIKSDNIIHLKEVSDLSINDILSFDISEIIQSIYSQINDSKRNISEFNKIQFIDAENFIIYNETIAILITYYDGSLYYHRIIDIQNDVQNKIKNIFTHENIIACELNNNTTIIKDMNDASETPQEKNVIVHDDINKLILVLFPIIIFSNYENIGIYYNNSNIKVKRPNIWQHNPDYIKPIL